VLRLVVVATGRVLVVGLIIGIVISIAATRMLAGKMQGMGTSGPLLFVVVAAALLIAAFAACFFPARAATRIQPMEALRHE
jgi:ABC-type antimicrobial peptide transport system permease subunit